MKFSALTLAALLPATALAQAPRHLEKRSVVGTVEVDGLSYRSCPNTSCTAIGQYAKGTQIYLVCFTRADTTVVNGDSSWAQMTNDDWVPVGFGHYVDYPGSLPGCYP